MDNKCDECGYEFNKDYENKCSICGCKVNKEKPYSDEDYEKAKQQGLDLDDWNDYVTYFELGEKVEFY
jgi:CDGSH-type Zn-finger protein